MIANLIKGIRKGDMASLARAISVIEDEAAGKAKLLKQIAAYKRTPAYLIGVTGSQGAGKSTLIEALAKKMRLNKKKVAIIAVDPTSPKTGGAFLGDRIRMQSLAEDEGVFIRSMASRGSYGGVAEATREAAFLCARAGFDFVLIETVGAGQLDFEVTKFADLTLLLLTPESGDQMQFMKAGLRELADAFIINKADRPGAQRLEDIITHMEKEPKRKVFKTAAELGEGVAEVYAYILKVCDAKKN